MGFVIRRFAAGEIIDKKYLLLSSVGRGASGEVFRARNLVAGNVLALKLLVEEQSADSTTVQRFFREARAINRIGHPNIVSVFDAGFAESTPYIAMEYLSGESLAQLLERRGKIGLPAAVAILSGILDALGAAHKANIIHRDLKPANVFLSARLGKVPMVKLLDFGVAKMREIGDTSLRTGSGLILGTPDYLSPEQVTADSEIDGRSDLFAAGVLFFELLTGERPFRGPSFVTTTYRIVHEEPPALASLGGPENQDATDVLARALAKKRDLRYPSAEVFVEALVALVPDPAARAEAMEDLEICSVTTDEPWQYTPPMAVGAPVAKIDEEKSSPAHLRKTGKDPEPDRPAEKTGPQQVKGTTWPELPLIGKKKPTKEPARHVRGTVLRAIDRAIATRYGADLRDEILQSLPKKLRETFLTQALHPDTWYPLAALESFVEATNRHAVNGQWDKWRALGYACVETDLLTLMRSASRMADAQTVLRAILPICSDLFDFGVWGVEDATNTLKVSVKGFSLAPRAVCDWLSGVLEHAVRSTGKPYRVSVLMLTTGDQESRVEFPIELR